MDEFDNLQQETPDDFAEMMEWMVASGLLTCELRNNLAYYRTTQRGALFARFLENRSERQSLRSRVLRRPDTDSSFRAAQVLAILKVGSSTESAFRIEDGRILLESTR